MRRRAGRGRAGERLPLDRARHRHGIRQMGHAGGRYDAPCNRRIPKVFFGGDAAFGPKNIIWAVAHGHEAAVSIDKFCHGEDVEEAAAAGRGAHQPEDGHPRVELRQRHLQRPALRVPLRDKVVALADVRLEVELGFDREARLFARPSAASTATSRRCSRRSLCIECDACVDICPMDCITFTGNEPEERAARTI